MMLKPYKWSIIGLSLVILSLVFIIGGAILFLLTTKLTYCAIGLSVAIGILLFDKHFIVSKLKVPTSEDKDGG